jgi:hypothetical protein
MKLLNGCKKHLSRLLLSVGQGGINKRRFIDHAVGIQDGLLTKSFTEGKQI